MFTMFNQLFNMLSKFFLAGDKAASALVNVTTVMEEMSATYADEQRVLRQAKLKALETEHGVKLLAQ